MANLICIGSSSSGNGYILNCDGEQLIIELGCKWSEYLKTLNHETENIKGILLSHFHQDHSSTNSVEKAVKFGFNIYSCQEVCDKFENVRLIETKKKYRIDGFLVQAISVNHSCECYAYIIEHESMGKMLFATDLTAFPYKINGLNHVLLEANNDEEVMIDNYIDGIYSRSASDTHLSIQKTIEILKANYSPSLQTVVLLHLSDSNSDERKFKSMVQRKLGFENVHIASSGMNLQINKEAF